MKGILDATFQEHAPLFRIREGLLKTGRRQKDAELAITNEDEQIFRARVRRQSFRGCTPVLRLCQRRDEGKQLPPRR